MSRELQMYKNVYPGVWVNYNGKTTRIWRIIDKDRGLVTLENDGEQKPICINEMQAWAPVEGEKCVFYSNYTDRGQYIYIVNTYGGEHTYFSGRWGHVAVESDNTYDNVMPLEYLDTLRDPCVKYPA